ncbi:MAG: RNA polymerase [Thermoplasmata archaeon]|nr:RNA polymerase [Thermoplasmata archaeon]MCI4361983.1 RNA polymerase [Thermoplasmata archaeon]
MVEPVPLSDVRKMLTDEAGRRPLPREALLAQQHAELFAPLPPEEVHKLVAELRTLPFIDANLAVKIADILPQYPEEVRLLFAKERVVLEEEQLTKLLELVAQYK